MISTGIDVGARNVKVVIVNDGKIVAKSIVPGLRQRCIT
jgi:activator of 2-hydroxyglutaryl-CoA dehydratase